ncbi:MAG TPA: tetratricopeptide repeat protein [Ktedonobacteraceae bacterium]|jgi:tetratricopeptide (TPR) repeat protein
MAAHKKTQSASLQVDETRVQQLLARRQALAQELHGCTSRAEAQRILADVFAAEEATQMGLLKSLVRTSEVDAADLLLAAHELAPLKTVRKEARRGLIQLASAKIYPSWTPQPEQAAVGGVAVENAPRFWQGMVAETREGGELQLILCWEYGFEYGEARLLSFLLDFWRGGVKEFETDTGSRRSIEGRLKEIPRHIHALQQEAGEEEHITYAACTLAEGRRLLNEALDVNRWRQTIPHKDFRQVLPLIQRLVLHADEVGEDRGLTFIGHDVEPEIMAANFAGAWSLGDYGLCYDLLTRDSPLQEGHSRKEWVEMRRRWADEAQPTRFEVYLLHERERASQTGIWLPASALALRGAAPKEIDMAWSLEVSETQLSGTLPEMPMGTAVYKETGRHWFWTMFVLEQEQGGWRIARIRDEGAAVQALSIEELQKRVREESEAVQTILREHQPDEPESRKHFEEVVRRTWQILALSDALLVRNPLDKDLYENAYGRAMSLRAIERAMVYVEELVRRFPVDPGYLSAQQRLGMLQQALGEHFDSAGLEERAARFAALSEATLRATLPAHDALSYILLAELLTSQQRAEEGEQLLREAREFAQVRETRAQIEFDLALIAIDQQHFAAAQGYLERLAEIASDYPALWAMLGSVHRQQGNLAEAEVAFRRSMEDDPTEERAYVELGTLYADRDELERARDIFSQGMRAIPQSAQLHALMALFYLRKDDERRAREYMQEAERLDPDLEIVQALREILK